MKNILLSVTAACAMLFTTGECSAQAINTFAGNGAATSTGDGGSATAASFNHPGGVYYSGGDLFVTEYSGAKIRKINSAGIVSTIAGTGVTGYGGDGGPATSAQLNMPIDVLKDAAGNIYIVDNGNHRIRKINPSGTITTFAGNGIAGYSGDGGPASAASLNWPSRIAIDNAGNIYIADASNNVIRKVNTAGFITTVAGTGTAGFSGDGGPATAATFNGPLGIAFDVNQNMYVADAFNRRIRRISPTGIITTFAGTGAVGVSGDGGPATAATMDYPNGVAVDLNCNVYFTDWNRHKVRKVVVSTGIISTVVGTGVAGFSGDGGPAITAQLNGANNLTFDPAMNLFIPEYYNNRVRKVFNLGETSICPLYIPTASFTTSDTTVCEDSCVTVSSTATSMGAIDSIRWTSLPATSVIASPTATTTTICFPNSGAYTVKLKVYGNGIADSATRNVVVTPTPHPVISRTGSTLSVAGAYTSYQWYKGTAIAGATTSSYTFTTPGIYSVTVDSAGCKGTSNTINTLGIGGASAGNEFWLSTNTDGTLGIHAAVAPTEMLTVALLDLSGRRIVQETWPGSSTQLRLNTADLRHGCYIIRLTSSNAVATFKWMK